MNAGVAVNRVKARLPARVRDVFVPLLEEPRLSQEELRRMVVEYSAALAAVARERDYLDGELATGLAQDCHRLLDSLSREVSEEHHRLVQAAVRYYVLDADAECDTDSLIGFDDDQLVVGAVAEEIHVPVRTIAG